MLVGLLPGGIVPVQVTVTVWPIVEGTVTLLVGGVAALTANRSNAIPVRRNSMLIATRAFVEAEAFFIVGLVKEKLINRSVFSAENDFPTT